jgi:hypothetical protein
MSKNLKKTAIKNKKNEKKITNFASIIRIQANIQQ